MNGAMWGLHEVRQEAEILKNLIIEALNDPSLQTIDEIALVVALESLVDKAKLADDALDEYSKAN